ncbi:hypothetical protein [Deinococcus wulumuqiensis]|uniref:Uncharacterized protein n=1 Tax=Deinococcus wulumuqiensis TaxID=980427 RepID=A0AAV4K7W6_9DEIO|nr:hypothetical protein [Deinococcus wulumuqiensis]QII20081.1 hypothetical protein G6R31_04345 [Deinococcus wulumuqiensis R12]GGI87492.1 hypothetical protein GCM10010914_22430 [Deinococcus wulumuqiensis]GGP30016.1 hypothetical protein GCM10008021_16670 [Deinococcus wulumuqiensis]
MTTPDLTPNMPTPEWVRGLLEGITPGEWQSGHESVWALGSDGSNRMYVLIQPGFSEGKRTPDSELDRNAALMAAAPALALAYLAQAAALAEREAECERLRKALTGASTALRLTEPEHGVPEYQAAQQHALRFIHDALTPTQEAQK